MNHGGYAGESVATVSWPCACRSAWMAAFEQAAVLAVADAGPVAAPLAPVAALLLDEMLEHPAVISPRPAAAAIAAPWRQPAPSLTLLIGHFLLKGHSLRAAAECLSCNDPAATQMQ